MKMKLIILSIMSGLLLTGCDQVKGSVDNYIKQVFFEGALKSPPIVISPGWKINDHGSVSEVYGNKDCPTSFDDDIRSGCIVIDQEDDTVRAFIVKPNSGREEVVKEVWMVERQGEFPYNNFRLKRPDNSYVAPWHQA
ncbi:hypothetical protein [Klebsiella pneumoniae]|uniref:hypothetical protein n=1 Tax=Klebsiella pneumoniae TaxID=573 RepID=UPI000B540BA6|nr:hypothetical protein [Klebsiella pneumoniae]MDI9194101.1 hypothetical protein [Raoultella ornithinolytica]HCB1502457.1 hypothetical protein [Klebsiella michiganensis]HCB1848923.1 hypothetical protein [Klebsiella oxytoca]ASG37022.1 hypothetical protein CES89_26805 [Klebsiella pneumoniae]MBR7606674.1 hypothetical protein [Klebsiella pneumoniae]